MEAEAMLSRRRQMERSDRSMHVMAASYSITVFGAQVSP